MRQNITKGVPQGSIIGPSIFNLFLNDIFACLNDTNLYNYADDNTICNYCRMAIFSVCFIFPFFPECYQTGIINTGEIYTVHVQT